MSPLVLPKTRWLGTALMAAVLLVIGLYGYSRTIDLVRGPQIEILSPVTGTTYSKEMVTVTGQVQHIAKIYLNDNQIFTDDQGFFREPLLLLPGYNILTLKAEDLFGRQITKQIKLVYQS